MLRVFQQSSLFATKSLVRAFGASFDNLVREHKILASNIQKIAEADRKFISFEVYS